MSVLVELGETGSQTVTGSLLAPSLYNNDIYSGGYPFYSISDGVMSCEASFAPDGASTITGTAIFVTLRLGEVTGTHKFLNANPGTVSLWELSCTYPTRKVLREETLTPENSSGYHYGSRTGTEDEIMDAERFHNGTLGWYYWPEDGAGSVTFTWTNGGSPDSYTLTGGGDPVGFVGLTDSWCQRINSQGAPIVLSANIGATIPDWSDTIWNGGDESSQDGVFVEVGPDMISAQWAGSMDEEYTHTARNFGIGLSGMPPQVIGFEADAKMIGGGSLPGTIDLNPTDGPPNGVTPQPVLLEFPTGSDIVLDTVTPWEGTGELYGYHCGWIFNAPGGATGISTVAVDTTGGSKFGFSFNRSDLAAAGLDGNAWNAPIMIPGSASTWDAIGAEVNDHFDFPEGWAAVGSESVSESAGQVDVTLGSGTMQIAKTCDYTCGLKSAGWFAFDAKCSSTGRKSLSVTGKTYYFDIAVADTWQAVELCLMAPDNRSGVDYSSTRYERIYPSASQGGWSWGLEDGIQLVLSFGTATAASVKNIRLLRKEHLLSAICGETISDDDIFQVSSDQWAHRVLALVSEGKVVLDEECGTVANRLYSSAPYSIEELYTNAQTREHLSYGLLALTNITPATTTTSGVLAAADWFNNRQPSYMLVPGLYGPLSGLLTLQARGHLHRVVVQPKLSQTFTISKRFGAGAIGLVANDGRILPTVDESQPPVVAGATVDLKQGSSPVAATTTDAAGEFRFPVTSSLYPTNADSTWYVIPQGDASKQGTMGRLPQWVFPRLGLGGFPPPESSDDVDYYEDALTGEGTVAFISGGQVQVARTYDSGATLSAPVTVADSADARRPCITRDTASNLRPWLLLWDEAGTVKGARSMDGFVTYELDSFLTGITHVRAIANPLTGVMLIAGWRISDGKIVAARSFDGGVTISTPAEVATAAEQGFGLSPSPTQLNTWTLTYSDSGTVVAYWSTDDGLTWSAAA